MLQPVDADIRHQNDRRVMRDLRKRLRRLSEHRVHTVDVLAEVPAQQRGFLIRKMRAPHHAVHIQTVCLLRRNASRTRVRLCKVSEHLEVRHLVADRRRRPLHVAAPAQ